MKLSIRRAGEDAGIDCVWPGQAPVHEVHAAAGLSMRTGWGFRSSLAVTRTGPRCGSTPWGGSSRGSCRPSMPNKRAGNLRGCPRLLGHGKRKSTARHLGIDIGDALSRSTPMDLWPLASAIEPLPTPFTPVAAKDVRSRRGPHPFPGARRLITGVGSCRPGSTVTSASRASTRAGTPPPSAKSRMSCCWRCPNVRLWCDHSVRQAPRVDMSLSYSRARLRIRWWWNRARGCGFRSAPAL